MTRRSLLSTGLSLVIGISLALALAVPSLQGADDARENGRRAKADDKKDAKKKKPASKWRDAADPLHVAAFEGDVGTMRKLLASKTADVNVKLGFRIFADYTPLHMAAYEGHAKVIVMLAAKKADLNLTEKKDKRTPLHLAAAYGRTEAVKALIKAGADINAKDKNKNTPLKLASDKAIIAELKKAGATEE